MKKFTPLFWRLLGVIRTKIDNYPFSEKWLKKVKKQAIYFIQIGANDGIFQDPIYKYSTNWSGVLVEPIPSIFEKLKKNYSNHKGEYFFLNSAISNYNGEIEIYLPNDYEYNESHTKIASVNNNISTLKNIDLQKINVPCITLNELIQQYKIKNIDLLVLDVEGYETVILNEYDFKILPKAIYFETRFYNNEEMVKIYEKFNALGYRIFPEKYNIFMILKH